VTADRLDGLADRLGDGEVLLRLGDPLDKTAVGLGEGNVADQQLDEPALLEQAMQDQVQGEIAVRRGGLLNRLAPLRTVLLSITGVLVVIIALSAAVSGGKSAGSGSAASPAASTSVPAAAASSPAASPPAANSPAAVHHASHTVTYIVWGSPAQVTYGPSGSDLDGTVPMRKTAALHDVSYYAISAQLQGAGKVSCEIRVNGKVIARSAATGAYNIAQCEIGQDPLTGAWQSDN
jgi:hypothetical protein